MAAMTTHELTCTSDFWVATEMSGEDWGTMWHMAMTLVTVSIMSSWCNAHKIKRLLLFFTHWLSGLLFQVSQVISGTMLYVCWANKENLWMIQTLKYIEMTAVNMLAVTNLAICINFALVVLSYPAMTRVKSVSNPRLILVFLLIAVAATVVVVPFWDDWAFTRTLLWATSSNPARYTWILIGYFFLEFGTGILMAIVVGLLLLFRMEEVRQCLGLHRRIRFYFGLTAIAVIANISIGICGVIFIESGRRSHMLLAVSWSLRHLHIALDTLGLYGVLGVSWRDLDEHAGGGSSREVPTSGTNVLKRYRTSGRLPRGSNSSSKRSSSLAAVGGKEAGTVDTTSQMR